MKKDMYGQNLLSRGPKDQRSSNGEGCFFGNYLKNAKGFSIFFGKFDNIHMPNLNPHFPKYSSMLTWLKQTLLFCGTCMKQAVGQPYSNTSFYGGMENATNYR